MVDSVDSIEFLTDEQRSMFQGWARKWISNGLSTEPVNKKAAEEAINECYRSAGLQPVPVVWVKSPLAGAVVFSIMLNSPKNKSVCFQIDSAVHLSINANIRSRMSLDVEQDLFANLYSQVHALVNVGIDSIVRLAIRKEFNNLSLCESIRQEVNSAIRAIPGIFDLQSGNVDDYGVMVSSASLGLPANLWSDYQAWQSFCIDVCGLRIPEHLERGRKAYQAVSENCGWLFPACSFCVAVERPTEIHIQGNTLYNEKGPAIVWGDGWKLWSLEGFLLDQQIVEFPETQTIEQINSEFNEEIKRIRINRFGWFRYIQESKATVIDFQQAPGKWLETLLEIGDIRVLCTYDPSTGRPYILEVDPSCRSCKEAQEYLLSPVEALAGVMMPPEEVYPVIRT